MKKGKRGKVALLMKLAILAVAVLLIGAACARIENVSTPSKENYRVVTDDLGREVRLPARVNRAISLAPNITEMVFAIGAGDRLVGDTTYCNYPEEAKAIQKVGDTLNPNRETIVALKPDVVLVSGASQLETFTKILEQNGIAVYVTSPNSIDDVLKNLKQLGEMFGTEERTDKLVSDLRKRMDEVNQKLFHTPGTGNSEQSRVAVFLQISKEPLFTIGKQSFLTDFLQYADAYSVTADVESAYPKLSKERALALNPEAIIISESPDNQEPNDAFRNSPAMKNGRVYKMNADVLSRPGPRLIDAMEQIAKDLHPEKFQ